MAERFEVDIFAYVLMDNHYHLLVRTNKANLSRAMQWFGTTYTTRFNHRHSKGGHLFQGRYKSILVENDAYLLQLSYYVHRNPLRSGLVDRLADYKWSSYPSYAYKKEHPDWLNTEFILSLMSGDDRHKTYRTKVQKYSKEEKRVREEIKQGLFYGTQAFINRVKDVYLKTEEETPDIGFRIRHKFDVDPIDILQAAAEIINIDIQKLKEDRRVSATDKKTRDLLVYLLWQSGNFSNSEIGMQFGLTYSSISRRVKIFQLLLDTNKKVRNEYERIKSQIKV